MRNWQTKNWHVIAGGRRLLKRAGLRKVLWNSARIRNRTCRLDTGTRSLLKVSSCEIASASTVSLNVVLTQRPDTMWFRKSSCPKLKRDQSASGWGNTSYKASIIDPAEENRAADVVNVYKGSRPRDLVMRLHSLRASSYVTSRPSGTTAATLRIGLLLLS